MVPLPTPPVAAVASNRLAAAWVAWVAASLLRGADADDLEDRLVEAGADRALASAALDEIASSPILAAARELVVRGVALERAARLHLEVDPGEIPERDVIDEGALYREHWVSHRPLVLRGAACAWPAARWTFAGLRARFAYAPMDVSVRRPGWWFEPRETRRMAFGDFVDVALGPPTDELYADGRSNLLDQAGLAPLRAELGTLPGLVGDGAPKAWVGPRGTITPTHHDQSTAWQVVLVGKKRLHLASPLEPELADTAVGLFNGVDPTALEPGASGVRWRRVELAAGDAIFVPAGWWHHVEALEPSISVSFSGFRWPNAFGWYLAG